MNAEVYTKEEQDTIDNVKSFMALLIVSVPFCMPILKLDVGITKESAIKTNGSFIKVNPKVWNKWLPSEKEGELMSEWLHVALFDVVRQGERIHRLWNAACNFRSNGLILSPANQISNVSSMTLPEGALYDPKFNGMSAEEVYSILFKEYDKVKGKGKGDKPGQSNGGQGQGQGKKGNGKGKYIDKEDFISSLDAEKSNKETSLSDDLEYADSDFDQDEVKRDIIRSAEMHSKMQGSLPGFYNAIIKELREAKLPWQQILATLIRQVLGYGETRSYQKTKRWACLYDMILPAEIGKKKPKVVIIIDTSGSISEHFITEFTTEIAKILRGVSECICITADAKVQEVVKVKNISDFISDNAKVKFKGRGGTDFVPALKEAANKRADLVIYFTDGFGNFGTSIFGIKRLLWVMTTQVVPPFGKYVQMR